MRRQQGLATLLVTSMMLVTSLLFSIASYKNVFYQIKRAQNEVLARKAHWLAEGGLECGYATLQLSPHPENADQAGFFPAGCNSDSKIDLSANKDGSDFNLVSTYLGQANATVKKSIKITSGTPASGGIQTGSNMYANSSLAFYNPDPGELVDGGWECVAVRYRGEYKVNASIKNFGLLATANDSFDAQGKDCLPTHKTNGFTPLSDFVHDPGLSPFEDFYGVSDSNHNEVRDNTFDIVIKEVAHTPAEGSMTEYVGMKGCATAINNALAAGHESIWVEGNCEISGDDYASIVTASNNVNGINILIHDGLFSVFPKPVPIENETDKYLKYEGIMFHYNLDYIYNYNDWKGSEAYGHLNHIPSNFGDNVKLASYYLHGALNIHGGVILDAKHFDATSNSYISQNALLNDSFGLTFYANYFAKFRSGSGSGQVKWIKGSWHDF